MSSNDREPEDHRRARLAARTAKYAAEVARLRQLASGPTYLDARRQLTQPAETDQPEEGNDD